MLQMIPNLGGYEIYGASVLALWMAFGIGRVVKERRSSDKHRASVDAGATEPPSLHPIIDPAKCVGCGACTHACPEGKIIGLIGGKAELLDAASCIGHGACKTACPVGAIELVFGTAKRGVDIPFLTPSFESNVPGVFIAGELGGMGLIANAIEQGRQAIDSIAALDGLGQRDEFDFDVIIVGGGPAGLAASLAANEKNLDFLTLEQDRPGGTVAHFPRGKLVMTRPAWLPGYGKLKRRRVRKESLLGLWRDVLDKTGVAIQSGMRVEKIERRGRGFKVSGMKGKTPFGGTTRAVLLAMGRRGSPRKLGILGEDLSKVVYSLDDPAQYRGQQVLVVGGGDSALEAAAVLAKEPGTTVLLSYRGPSFSRARSRSIGLVEKAVQAGRLSVLFDSSLVAIHGDSIEIEVRGQRYAQDNHAVIICAGGVLPTDFLSDIGIGFETRYGTAGPAPVATAVSAYISAN